MSKAPQRRRGPRGSLLVLTAFLALGMTYCSLPTNPGAPSWDVPFGLPFSAQTYDLYGLVTDSTQIAQDGSGLVRESDGSLGFVFTDSIARTEITQEQLTFDPNAEQTYITSTDTLVVPLNQSRTETLDFDVMLDAAGVDTTMYNDGDSYNLPAFNFPTQTYPIQFSALDTIRDVHVAQGSIELTVVNNNNVTWDSFTMDIQRLNDQSAWVNIGTLSYPNLGPQESRTDVLDLGGQTLSADVRLEINGGASSQTVTMNHSHNLQFDLYVDTLKVDTAYAHIAEQNPVSNMDSLALAEEDWISSAYINSGKLYFAVRNETDVEAEITLEFPDVYDPQGNIWSETFSLERRRTGTTANTRIDSIDMSQYELRLDLPQTAGAQQFLRARTVTHILGSGVTDPNDPDYYSRLAAGDTVETRFSTSAFEISYFAGLPKNITVESSPTPETQSIDFWQGNESLQNDLAQTLKLANARIDVDLENQFRIRAILELFLSASNSQTGVTFDTTYIDTLAKGQKNMAFDDLQRLINVMPDAIAFKASVKTGRDYFGSASADTVGVGDYVEGTYSLTSALAVTIADTAFIRAPMERMEPFNDAESISNILLQADITNTVPMGGRLYLLAGSFPDSVTASQQLYVRDDATDQYNPNLSQYRLSDTAIRIPSPELDPNTGRAVAPVQSQVSIDIPENKVAIFGQDNVWFRQVLVIYPSLDNQGNPVPLAMFTDDAIDVSLNAEITYSVDPSSDDEE